MAPDSAATAARVKLLSLASFGLFSGACFLIGYYFFRRYKQSSEAGAAPTEEKLAETVDDLQKVEQFCEASVTPELNQKCPEQELLREDTPGSKQPATDSILPEDNNVASCANDDSEVADVGREGHDSVAQSHLVLEDASPVIRGSELLETVATSTTSAKNDARKTVEENESFKRQEKLAPEETQDALATETTLGNDQRPGAEVAEARQPTFKEPKEQILQTNAASLKQNTLPERKPRTEAVVDEAVVQAIVETEQSLEWKEVEGPRTVADTARKAKSSQHSISRIPEPIGGTAYSATDVQEKSVSSRKREAELQTPGKRLTEDKAEPTEDAKYNKNKAMKPVKDAKEQKTLRSQEAQIAYGGSQLQAQKDRFEEEPSKKLTSPEKVSRAVETSAAVPSSSTAAAAAAAADSPSEQETASGISGKVVKNGEQSTLINRTTKSLLPLRPLTPPPEDKHSRRQRDRGARGAPVRPATASAVLTEAAKNNSGSSGHRWSPFEDKTIDNVEVDTSSQQVLWKTTKNSDSDTQSGQKSPWSPIDVPQDENSVTQIRSTEFDDNFVDTISSRKDDHNRSSAKNSELTVQSNEGAPRPSTVTKESSLLNATPECVMERKPLISEDGEDDDDEENEDCKFGNAVGIVGKTATKNIEVVKHDHQESTSNEEGKKLIEIDQDCVGSLMEMTGPGADHSIRLASLRALVNLSWTTEKHHEYAPSIGQFFANIDGHDASLRLESLRVLANLAKNPSMVPNLLAAKAPTSLLKLLVPETNEEVLTIWLGVLDNILWTSKEMCLTYASLPTEYRVASPETVYTGLYGLKNSRILKSRIFVLSRNKSQQVTYLASRIYSCLTS